jgi:hypothetical protein
MTIEALKAVQAILKIDLAAHARPQRSVSPIPLIRPDAYAQLAYLQLEQLLDLRSALWS